jgi:hypothetical protein
LSGRKRRISVAANEGRLTQLIASTPVARSCERSLSLGYRNRSRCPELPLAFTHMSVGLYTHVGVQRDSTGECKATPSQSDRGEEGDLRQPRQEGHMSDGPAPGGRAGRDKLQRASCATAGVPTWRLTHQTGERTTEGGPADQPKQ